MQQKYRVLDLFCGAGGVAVGLHYAGFEVIGVDKYDQPEYPYRFIKADVFTIKRLRSHFDFVWASPQCQRYSIGSKFKGTAHLHEDTIPKTRDLITSLDLPYVIENVIGAPLFNPIMLCGTMFGLGVRRHRLFESSIPLTVKLKCLHTYQTITVAGHGTWTVAQAQRAMQINHIKRKYALAQAVPPAYSYAIGRAVIKYLDCIL